MGVGANPEQADGTEGSTQESETLSDVSPRALGLRLRQARDLKQLSISVVAKEADISTAYLQKLEVGDVRNPSPNVLFQLSQALDIDYSELMRLAGYVIPNSESLAEKKRNELTYALSSVDLTEEEAATLAEYLDWYRSRRNRTGR